jgi:hypothetical protein
MGSVAVQVAVPDARLRMFETVDQASPSCAMWTAPCPTSTSTQTKTPLRHPPAIPPGYSFYDTARFIAGIFLFESPAIGYERAQIRLK